MFWRQLSAAVTAAALCTNVTATPSNSSFLYLVAPAVFPLEEVAVGGRWKEYARTGYNSPRRIRFPEGVTDLIIDIGALRSGFAREGALPASWAVIFFEPVPANIAELQRALDSAPHRDRRFIVPAAVSSVEGAATFHRAAGPSCGSLLRSTAATGAGSACQKTVGEYVVPVVTLASLFEMLPPPSGEPGGGGGLRHRYLKIDTEGADHLVLRGAGPGLAALGRFGAITVECNDQAGEANRVGGCVASEVIDYLRPVFPLAARDTPGGATCNVHFGRRESDIAWARSMLWLAGGRR